MYRSVSLSLLVVLSLSSCSSYNGRAQADALDVQKMAVIEASIEDEPITKMSFVSTQDEYDDIEVVLYQEDGVLNEIMPASGE